MATIKGRSFCGLFDFDNEGRKTRKVELGGVAPIGDDVFLSSNFLVRGVINWDLIPDECREELRRLVYFGRAGGVEKR